MRTLGGGTAGLAVATRLSEDPHITVAVIEAGVHYTDEALVDTPGSRPCAKTPVNPH